MSFDKEHLDNLAGCKNLNYGEKTELEGWIEKFQVCRPFFDFTALLFPNNQLMIL
jgi:hypothetical protein